MHIMYGVGDIQIGAIVCLVINPDAKGIVTGIQIRDNSISYLVTFMNGDIPNELYLRPIEIRIKK